jgi:8-oxo-dGTP diphosphatase
MIKAKIVVKTFIFRKDGRLLAIKRRHDDLISPGDWDVPGGSIKYGENFLDGIVRETNEEVRLKIAPNSFKLVYSFTEIKDAINVVRLYFAVQQNEYEEVVLSHEHSEYKWITVDEAIDYMSQNKFSEVLLYVKNNNLIKM